MTSMRVLFYSKNLKLSDEIRALLPKNVKLNVVCSFNAFSKEFLLPNYSCFFINYDDRVDFPDVFFVSAEILQTKNIFWVSDDFFCQNSFKNIRIIFPDDIKKIFSGGNFLFDFNRRKTGHQLSLFAGSSNAVSELKKKLIDVSKENIPVLLTGESGSGKTLAANVIHLNSERKEKNFLPVNVKSIAESLFESELFGTIDGAFTDSKNHNGYLAVSDGGSLFLDEIGELGLKEQTKLLRVIETGRYRKVGSTVEQKADVRFIFATNADLRKKVSLNEMREDFFYRINRYVIEIPPLRARSEDIPYITQNFLKKAKRRISPSALEMLVSYQWPGNVRQLLGTLEATCVSCPFETIDSEFIKLPD